MQTKEQRNAYRRKWRQENKERIREVDRKWIRNNRDRINSKQKERRLKNKQERTKKTREIYRQKKLAGTLPCGKASGRSCYQKYKQERLTKAYEYYHNNKEYVNSLRKENRLKTRKDLMRAYGITLETFNQMKIIQNNKCKICEIDFSTLKNKNVHVDHCHTTGKVRGVLCRWCNHVLGNGKDSIEILESAIQYLRESKELEMHFQKVIDSVQQCLDTYNANNST